MDSDIFTPTRPIESHFHADAQLVIRQGDACEFVASLPTHSISLIITSPPYNLGKDYESRLSMDAYLAQQTQLIVALYRVLKEGGSICWQVGNFVENGEVYPLDIPYYTIFKKLNLSLRNRIIWRFGHGLHASKRFSGRYETILWFTKGEHYTFNLDAVRVSSKYPGKRHYKGPHKGKLSGNPLGKNPSDIWEIVAHDWETAWWDIPNVKSNHPEKTIHPCQYPIELAERCILALTNEDEWVLDPYMGVGTSLIAAMMHNRRAVGSEKEADYVEIAKERIISYFDGSFRHRILGTAVHQPTGKEKVAQVPEEWEQRKQVKLLEEREEYK